MRRALGLIVLASLVVTASPAGADAAPDKTGKVVIGTPFAWDGTRKVGANPYYFRQHSAQPNEVGPLRTYTCSAERYQTCETVLLEFSNPLTQAEIDAGKTSKTKAGTVIVNAFDPAPSDFDFVAYASDAQGTKGEFFTGAAGTSTSGNNAGDPESKTFDITTTIDAPSVWMLLEVVYFAAPNATYKGTARF